MSSNANSELSIDGIPLQLYLGVSEDEKSSAQTVYVSLKIFHKSIPDGCYSDKIEDTFCYDKLYKAIKNKFDGSTHNLLEHLAMSILEIFSNYPKSSIPHAVDITINKVAAIRGFNGSIAFTLKKSF